CRAGGSTRSSRPATSSRSVPRCPNRDRALRSRMRSFRLSLALSALVSLSCAPPPCAAGSDAIVSGTWTVEGAAPPATSCSDVGIDVVRLGVYCGGNPTYLDRLEAPCTAGQLDSGTAVLAAGTYDVAWEGFRGDVRVAQGARHTLVATAGGRATVPVVD